MTKEQKIWFAMNQQKRRRNVNSEKQDGPMLLCDNEGRIVLDSTEKVIRIDFMLNQ